MLWLDVKFLPVVFDDMEFLAPLFEVTATDGETVDILNYGCVGCERGGNKYITQEQGRRWYKNPWGELREDNHVEWPLQEDDVVIALYEDESVHKVIGCNLDDCPNREIDDRREWFKHPQPVRWYTYENWLEIFGDRFPDEKLW